MQLNQHVNKIILFGSVARGDDTSESDIDILIIISSKSAVEKFINLPYEKKVEMGLAARRKMENEFNRDIVTNIYFEEIRKILNNL